MEPGWYEDPLALRGRRWLLVPVLDAALLAALILTIIGYSPVFAFHLAFAVLMTMSLVHEGIDFVARALFGFVATVLAVVWAVRSGHLLSYELHELPILSGMAAFAAWAMHQLRRLIRELSEQSGRLQELHAASRLEYREQMLLAQRMESAGQLSAGVAHNLRNVLSTIWSIAERIEDEDEGAAAAEPARRIQEQTAKGGDLLTRLLHHARPGTGPVPADLVAAVEAELPSLEIAVGADIDVELIVESRPLPVRTSAALIEQLLVNLVLNSAKATPGVGRITVTVGPGELASTDRNGGPADAAVLSVADEGVGMTDEVRRRAFEPFFSTDVEREGAGLGLYSALLIAEGAGGTIKATVDRPIGCEIVVTLPLADPDEIGGVEPSFEPRLDELWGTERVLVADDDDVTRERLCSTLALYGYDVVAVTDGESALELLRASTFDLLVSDIVMPVMSGLELVATARAAGVAPADILFVSGDPDAANLMPPGSTLLRKPFSRNVFLGRVRRALDEEARELKSSS